MTTSNKNHQCEGMVRNMPHDLFRCRNRAKVQVDGKWYCGVHDPRKRAVRVDRVKRRVKVELDLSRAKKKLQNVRDEIVEAVLRHSDSLPSRFGLLVAKCRAAQSKVEADRKRLTAIASEK